MEICFDNPDYDGHFLRALDCAPLGAQIGEAWAIAVQIQPGDTTSWYNAWSSYADQLYELAIKSRTAVHRIPARIELLAHRLHLMFAAPVDPRVIQAYEKQTTPYRKPPRYLSRRSRFSRFRMTLQHCPVISSNPMRATHHTNFVVHRRIRRNV